MLAQYETKDLQRLSEIEIKLNTIEQDVSEVRNHAFDEDQYNRKFDSFFYRTILPKVGEIVDREKSRLIESLDRLRGTVTELDLKHCQEIQSYKIYWRLIWYYLCWWCWLDLERTI